MREIALKMNEMKKVPSFHSHANHKKSVNNQQQTQPQSAVEHNKIEKDNKRIIEEVSKLIPGMANVNTADLTPRPETNGN